MDEEIMELLDGEIISEIEALAGISPGTNEHTTAVDNLTKLYRLRIDEARNRADADEKYNRRIMENEQYQHEAGIKEKQIADEEEFRKRELRIKGSQIWTNLAISMIGAGVQIGLAYAGFKAYDAWYTRGLKFEETGMVSSPMLKNLQSKMLPSWCKK